MNASNDAVVCASSNLCKDGATFLMKNNFRVFARAVFALNRIGDELYLEPSHEGLALRSVNCTKSAYAAFLFSASFFASYDVSKIKNNEFNLCRISMKPALMAFKCAKNSEKSILSCRLFINPKAETVLVELTHTYDVVKCHEIPLLDCTMAFRNIVDKADLEDRLMVAPSVMMGLMAEIRQDTTDITFNAKKESFVMKNYISKDQEFDKLLKTEVQVLVGEFERYIIPKDAEITVNCKELKAFVVFADYVQSSLNLFFEEAGSPLVISLENNVHFTAELTVATVDNSYSVVEQGVEVLKENVALFSKQLSDSSCYKSTTNKRCSAEYEAESSTSHSQQIHNGLQSFSMPPKKHKECSGLEKNRSDGAVLAEEAVDYADEVRDEVRPIETRGDKFRQYFLSSSQCTLDASQLFINKSIIAPDSDDEN